MQSLLQWGIANSSSDTPPPRPRTDLDPAILDAILGKPDSQLMKEALATAVDEGKDEDERLTALDDFELLIEQIDNANNIAAMNMWPTIQGLVTSSSSSDDIKASALWIVGTAVQNNPAAQGAYLTQPNALSTILQTISPNTISSATRSKALYALSGILKHNGAAVKSLDELGGWVTLKSSLQDPDIKIRRKVAFLFNTLLLASSPSSTSTTSASASVHTEPTAGPVHPNSHASMTAESAETSSATQVALQKYGILDILVDDVVSPVPHGEDGDVVGDEDFQEKVARILYTYLVSCNGNLSSKQSQQLGNWLKERASSGTTLDLTSQEYQSLLSKLR